VRLEVLGFRDLPLQGEALDMARRLVREGIEQGAVGFSTGSSYYPGPWSTTDELIELCRVVRELGGVFMCEPRRANVERAYGGGGVPEALHIARETGVPLHFAHFRTSAQNAGKTDELMAEIDAAKAQGVDCTLDVYPYPAGSSIPVSYLPSYAQDGGPDAIVRRLEDPGERARIARYLEEEHMERLVEVVFSYLPRNRELEGLSLNEVSARRGTPLGETLCDLLLEEDLSAGYVGAPPESPGLFRQVSRDCIQLLARPDYMVCSDITPAGGMPHPRSYGAFPRFLGRLRREFDVLSLEQMVNRMTDSPARRFGLTKRGRVQKGFYADLVVFDPEHVIDTATYDDPKQFPVGIPFVLVNGRVAVDNERCTGVMAGQAVP
jgi:N-acyl-D-amino-acid deacylase